MKKSTFDAIAKAAEGIPVYQVFENTPAFNAGIKSGDVIISVNGVNTPTIDKYIEASKLDTVNKQVSIWRLGQVIKVQYSLNKNATMTDALSNMMESSFGYKV